MWPFVDLNKKKNIQISSIPGIEWMAIEKLAHLCHDDDDDDDYQRSKTRKFSLGVQKKKFVSLLLSTSFVV